MGHPPPPLAWPLHAGALRYHHSPGPGCLCHPLVAGPAICQRCPVSTLPPGRGCGRPALRPWHERLRGAPEHRAWPLLTRRAALLATAVGPLFYGEPRLRSAIPDFATCLHIAVYLSVALSIAVTSEALRR